jgi:hypothetical protein
MEHAGGGAGSGSIRDDAAEPDPALSWDIG